MIVAAAVILGILTALANHLLLDDDTPKAMRSGVVTAVVAALVLVWQDRRGKNKR
ncbi:hypothetical protein [Actinoplanes sp. L3-i22]|uniref:hypothetical protein n=1 Tax=Actinoplanes sp. L3-i22 TaxID=2836373 RepID=UPI001C759193|nr:hypothetical protein [Actinoplanes sp. L3-i22]BCY11644.1 hypothetical protein L3i22_067320 [Actinoplanes sp. L3-i22]